MDFFSIKICLLNRRQKFDRIQGNAEYKFGKNLKRATPLRQNVFVKLNKFNK